MNQVLSREEVAALLQGVAEAESNCQQPALVKKPKAPGASCKTKANHKLQREYLAGSPR